MPLAGGNRQTFRPPWVKDGPQPIPMPSTPWVKNTRAQGSATDAKDAAGVVTKVVRKVSDAGKPADASGSSSTEKPERKKSSISIIPTQLKENGNASVTSKSAARKISEPVPTKVVNEVPRKISEPAAPKPISEKTIPIERTTSKPRVLERSQTSDKYEGLAVAPKPPAAPPMPPPPPPLPTSKEMLPDKPSITEGQKAKLEALRSRPKRRPDWGNMMKEIETSRKLCHVVSNDRSAPLLPRVKAKGQFVYESERPNLHNQLLKQIASGIKLKPTRTNDRSKPFIDGLRKFRRQMTIEEQIQKSTSIASMGIAEIEPDPLDEVDDIDKVRDDLQSTKQLLAMELKNKEALERENKKLLTRILNLEVEMEKNKFKTEKDEPEDKKELRKEMDTLRADSEKAKKFAEDMETKFQDTQSQLELTKIDLDEAVKKAQRLEKQLKVAQAANLANASSPLSKQMSSKKIANQNKVSNAAIAGKQVDIDSEESEEDDEEEEEETESEAESEKGEEDAAAAAERRQQRELKLLASKLKSFKGKREIAKKERKTLKEQTVKQQKSLKDEKKKYKLLQKEVDKMSKLMNEEEEDEEEEEENCDDETEEDEESDESEEFDSESESESEESDGDLPETAAPEAKKTNLQNRVKRYENLVSSLKKGNYLLKANVERYRDELNKQKEMSLSLQEDLNSVLAELG